LSTSQLVTHRLPSCDKLIHTIEQSMISSTKLLSFAKAQRKVLSVEHVRCLNSSTTDKQKAVAQETDGLHENNKRPAAVQTTTMLDIGTRSIFNADNDMFREHVRRFMKEKLAPLQTQFEEAGEPTREIWQQMGDLGLLGVSTPAEVGGVGGSFIDEAIVAEEMSYAMCASPAMAVHSTITLPYLAHYGNKEQQDRYIPDMTAGKCIGSIGMTEPDAGSDLQGIRTTAKRDGSDWIINGSKIYITNGWLTDCCVLVAKTKPDAKRAAHGISLFLVDADTPGFHKGRKLNKLGLKGQDTAELFFEDVRVPAAALLGKENGGFYQLMEQLPQERLILAVHSTAHCEAMFEETRDWVKQRKAFGRHVSDLQTVQHKLAELKTSIAVCRSFIDECMRLHNEGRLCGEMASMAKYWATDLENKVAGDCLQLHGGWGYMWETNIAKSYAHARVQTIYGGTNEIMKELIARNIVKN